MEVTIFGHTCFFVEIALADCIRYIDIWKVYNHKIE